MDEILTGQCVFCGALGTMRSTNNVMCGDCAAYWLAHGDESLNTLRLERDALRAEATRVAEACAECLSDSHLRVDTLIRYVAELDAARAEVDVLRRKVERIREIIDYPTTSWGPDLSAQIDKALNVKETE